MRHDGQGIQSALEKVTCEAATVTGNDEGIENAALVARNKMNFSSNEKSTPMEMVFMNCSMVYFLISRQSPGRPERLLPIDIDGTANHIT